MSTASVVRKKPFSATATPPTTMNLTFALARLTNNFSYGVSIVGRSCRFEACSESVEAIKAVPDIGRARRAHDLLKFLRRPRLSHRSLHVRKLFHIDPLQPFLEFFRLLVLRFDGEDVALRDHEPKGAVFAFVLEGLEPGHPL